MATLEALAKPGNRARSCEGEGRLDPAAGRIFATLGCDVQRALEAGFNDDRGERLVCGRWVGEQFSLSTRISPTTTSLFNGFRRTHTRRASVSATRETYGHDP